MKTKENQEENKTKIEGPEYEVSIGPRLPLEAQFTYIEK